MLSALDTSMNHFSLYDRSSDLFYKGAYIRDGKIIATTNEHHDIPTAKAITLGYVQCARRAVPKEHLDKLFSRMEISCNSVPHIFLPIDTDLPRSDSPDDINDIDTARFIAAFGDSMSKRFMSDGVMGCAKGLIKGLKK